jgi:rRNA maturation endonuclease Nob1
MKNMSAAEMLALQAVDLAAKGASADMVKGITDASSGVKVAEAKEAAAKELLAMQEKMFERMLAQQNQSSDREAAAHKLAVNVAVEANVKSMDSMMQVAKVSAGESSKSYKDAAEMSRSVNEKSMDSMAKVATAAAAHSTDGFNQAAEISRSVNEKSMESMAKVYSTAISGAYVCQGCKKEVPETSNFCTGCGAPKVKD